MPKKKISTKLCGNCNKRKPLSSFHENKCQKDGRQTQCKDCKRAKKREYYAKNSAQVKLQQRGYRLQKKYGISDSEYKRLFKKQAGMCALCGKPSNGRRLDVDHDHVTGKVRGLLHRKCNQGLGYFDDDPELLKMAIKYLES